MYSMFKFLRNKRRGIITITTILSLLASPIHQANAQNTRIEPNSIVIDNTEISLIGMQEQGINIINNMVGLYSHIENISQSFLQKLDTQDLSKEEINTFVKDMEYYLKSFSSQCGRLKHTIERIEDDNQIILSSDYFSQLEQSDNISRSFITLNEELRDLNQKLQNFKGVCDELGSSATGLTLLKMVGVDEINDSNSNSHNKIKASLKMIISGDAPILLDIAIRLFQK